MTLLGKKSKSQITHLKISQKLLSGAGLHIIGTGFSIMLININQFPNDCLLEINFSHLWINCDTKGPTDVCVMEA